MSLATIVKGNTFSLAIPLQVYAVEDGELVLRDYIPESGDAITIRLKGDRRNYTYIPATNGSTAFIHLEGSEVVGVYAVEVEIVKDDDSKLTSMRFEQLNIVESIDELNEGQITEGIEQGAIYLDPEIFIAGKDGRGIVSIVKTATSGLVDTYTITYTDNTTSTFNVTNGANGINGQDGADGQDGVGIASIAKTGTQGLVDTYTITMTNGTTYTYQVTNGKDGQDGADGQDGTDGVGIVSITKTSTSGLVDTYTILLTNGTTTTFTVTNGSDATQVQSDWNETDTSSLAYIKNKPTIPTVPTNVSAFINDAGYVDADPTVGQNKTTNNADYHLLLSGGDGTADRAVSESKYSTSLDFNPSTKLVKLSSSYKEGSGILETTYNTDIQIGGAGLSIVKKQAGSTVATGSLSATNYSGTAAKATADGSGNTISTTYSTKSELSNYCPIIEDTRTSDSTDITTSIAPFNILNNSQRIILKVNRAIASNSKLIITLSDSTTTAAIPMYCTTQNGTPTTSWQTGVRGGYIECVYESGENRWVMVGQRDTNTTYGGINQSQIDSGGNASPSLITSKLFHDNAYIVSLAYSSGSLKANKMYDFGTVSTALTIPSLDATNDLVSNALNFYALRFIAGADNISITFPTGVLVDDTPTINTGDYVEIMINKYGNNFYASIKVWQAQ